MISVLSVDRQVIFAATALMPSVMAVMNLAILPRTVPTRFLHQEHHTTMEGLIQGINTPTTGGTEHTPIMVPDIEDITSDHSPTPISTATEAATLEGIPHTLLPATTAAHATLQLMDFPTVITTGIVTPHPALTISPVGATPLTEATLTPACLTMQHKILSPGKSRNAKDPQPLINPTAPKYSPSMNLLQAPHQILTVTQIL